jgi:hypothetical protein
MEGGGYLRELQIHDTDEYVWRHRRSRLGPHILSLEGRQKCLRQTGVSADIDIAARFCSSAAATRCHGISQQNSSLARFEQNQVSHGSSSWGSKQNSEHTQRPTRNRDMQGNEHITVFHRPVVEWVIGGEKADSTNTLHRCVCVRLGMEQRGEALQRCHAELDLDGGPEAQHMLAVGMGMCGIQGVDLSGGAEGGGLPGRSSMRGEEGC